MYTYCITYPKLCEVVKGALITITDILVLGFVTFSIVGAVFSKAQNA